MSCKYKYNDKWYSEEELKNLFDKIPKGPLFQLNKFQDLFENEQVATRMNDRANSELNKKLEEYLGKHGVTVERLNSIRENYGIDAVGATDILNKIILLDKNKEGLDTLPEEAAHIFTMMMSSSEDMDWMLENIIKWEGYKQVYQDYFAQYEGDEKKIRFEAVGKFIALHLIKQEPTVSAEIKQGIFKRIWKFILELLGNKDDIKRLNTIARDIATKVLNDESLIDITIPEGFSEVNTSEAFKGNYGALQIHEKLKDRFLLTGSAALATQGKVYRSDENPLHDLDYINPDADLDISKEIKNIFPNAEPVHQGIQAVKYVTKAFLIPPPGISVGDITYQESGNFKGWITGYKLFDKKNKQVGLYETSFQDGKLLKRQEGIKPFWVDFFQYSKQSDVDIQPSIIPGFSNWDRTFKAKLEMARDKDVKDWLNFRTPYILNKLSNDYTFFQLENNELDAAKKEYAAHIEVDKPKSDLAASEKLKDEINTKYPTLQANIIDSGDIHRIVVFPKSDLGEEIKGNTGNITTGTTPTSLTGNRIEQMWNDIGNIAKDAGVVKLGDKEGYVDKDGKKLERITDKVKRFYAGIFKRNMDDLEAEKRADNDQKAERGTEFHKDMENMFRMFTDPYTGKKNYSTPEEMNNIDLSGFVPTMKVTDKFKDDYINIVAGYVKDKLDTYSSDARFLFETIVYNKSKNRAGTIDFIAIDHKGIDILDWKSIFNLSDEGKIYPTKREGFNIQLNEYYNSIKYSVPSVSDDDFNEIRVIPVLPKRNTNGEIYTLDIGKVKPVNDQVALLPVLSEKDIAYKGSIKKLLDNINEVLQRENKRLQRETGFKRIEDYKLKQEVDEAIQQVIIQQNPEELFRFLDEIQKRADNYLREIDKFNKSQDPATESDRIAYQEKLRDATIAINGIRDFLAFSKENLPNYADKEKINSYAVSIVGHIEDIKNITRDFIAKIATSNDISSINKPQLEIGFIKKWTTFFLSNPQTKATQLFAKIIKPIKSREVLDKEDAKLKLVKTSEALDKWAKDHKMKLEDVYKMFLSEDKDGNFNGQINSKIDNDFFTKRDEAFAGKGKKKFLLDNYKIKDYLAEADTFISQQSAKIDGDSSLDNEQKTRKKDALKRKYKDAKTAFTADNHFLHSKDENGNYRFIKEEGWYSDFYKEITKPGNEPLLQFYNYMLSLNRRAKNTGLVPDNMSNYFMPQVLKGLLETGWNLNDQKDRYLASIGVDINKFQFGDFDPISGQIRERRFIPYTFDLSKVVDGKKDYSQVSTDLVKSFGAFEQSLIEVENTENLESFFQILRDFEKANEVFDVNIFGKPKKRKGTNGQLVTLQKGTDSDNYRYLDTFGRYLVYGQRLQNFTDVALPTPFKDKEGNTQHISAVRLIQSMASLNRMAVLGGINITAPLRNFVMGRLSTHVQKSPYFSSTSSLSNAIDFLQRFKFSLTNEKHQKMAASLEYFAPHLMNQGKLLDKVSMYSGYQLLTTENMMKLLEKSEEFITLPVHFALLENSTVRDGEIVNINTLVKDEFKQRYATKDIYRYINMLPKAERVIIEKEMAARVRDLIKTDNLYNYIELIKDADSKDITMSIKGVDRHSPSVYKVRDITQNIARKATGTASDTDFNQLKTSFVGTMASMFRSWIPRTVQARFGEYTPNILSDYYEEGRMISLVNYAKNMHEGNLKRFGKLLAGLVGVHDKKSIQAAIDKIYEKKTNSLLSVNKISRKDEISPEEFTKMYMDNIESAYRDLRATAALMIIIWSGILAAGGGDDDRNYKRALARELDKYRQEFTFYYDPMSAFQIIKDPFPILNFHSNLIRIAEETAKLTYNYDEATPGKFILKTLPISNFFIQYMPLFDEQLAKDWNIRINPTTFNR